MREIAPFIARPEHIIEAKYYDKNYPYYEEFKREFIYYEITPLEKITFDDRHTLAYNYFSAEGYAYILSKLLEEGFNDPDLSSTHLILIIKFSGEPLLYRILDILPQRGIDTLKKWFEFMLKTQVDGELIKKEYLLNNINKIEEFENNR